MAEWVNVMSCKKNLALPVIFFVASFANAAPPPPDIELRQIPDSEPFLSIAGRDSDREVRLRSDLGDQAVRSWQVELNIDALTAIEGRDGGRVTAGAGALLAGQFLDVAIPDSQAQMRLNLDTVYFGYGGVVTYAGKVQGDDGSLVAISTDGENVFGKIYASNGYTYLIEHHSGRAVSVMSVVDRRHMPRDYFHHDTESVSEPSSRTGALESAVGTQSTGGEVRVLIMYTTKAADELGNISLTANNIIAMFNQSLVLSGVDSNNFVTLADLIELGSDLNGMCNDNIIAEMQQGMNAFTNLDSWMNAASANIGLSIYTTELGYQWCPTLQHSFGRIGGMAFLIPPGFEEGPPNPFAGVTHTFALGDLTAVHELGHVLNGVHESGDVPRNPPWAKGYAHSSCQWQTIMGGYVECSYDFGSDPDQQPTDRIARWSSPDLYYFGVPTGTSAQDMVAALNVTMPLAALWGTSSAPSVPSAPNPISVQHWYCFGGNTVSWTEQPQATEYRLFKSYSSGFSSPQLVYSGPARSASVNVSGTAYVRVKACNSSGCSGYSSQEQVSYFNGCM